MLDGMQSEGRARRNSVLKAREETPRSRGG